MAAKDTAAGRREGRARAAELAGLDLSLRGLDELVEAMGGPAALALMEEQTDIMHRDAQSRARFGKTGRYREAIRKKVFDNEDGPAGTVFVIPVRDEDGKRKPKNLPVWLEYGTRRARAFPHLLPALAAAKERLSRAVERLLQSKVTNG